MILQLPDPGAVSPFDLSCVGAAKVDVIGNDPGDGQEPQVIERCFDFPAVLQSFTDVGSALRNRFTFDMPNAGLAGVELRGFAGRCSDPSSSTYESVFYGGAARGSGATLVVPVLPIVSCNTAQIYKIRVLDLVSIYATLPGGATCSPPSDSNSLFAGVIRPRMLGTQPPLTMFEYGASSIKTTDGTGTLQSFAPIFGPSCIAFIYRGASSLGATCADTAPQPRGLCGKSDETEIVAVPVSALPSLPLSTDTFGTVLIGAVWESSGTSQLPLAGATVALPEPSLGHVVYVDLGIQADSSPPRLRPMTPIADATSTRSGGGFVVYFTGLPTNLTVSAPGHATQTLRIASGPDVIATTIVVLPSAVTTP